MTPIATTTPRQRRTDRRRNLPYPEERRGSRGQIVARMAALSVDANR